jgi:hypothetical protein
MAEVESQRLLIATRACLDEVRADLAELRGLVLDLRAVASVPAEFLAAHHRPDADLRPAPHNLP